MYSYSCQVKHSNIFACSKMLKCLIVICFIASSYAVSTRSYADGPCAIKLAAVIAEQAQHVVYGLERPFCDNVTGEYLGKQFSGSQAVCVTKNGTFIPGYMVYRWLGDDMNCQCARDEFHYKESGLVGKTFTCQTNGNYGKVGCTGSVCYCQDQNGQQIGTSTVDIGAKDSMNC